MKPLYQSEQLPSKFQGRLPGRLKSHLLNELNPGETVLAAASSRGLFLQLFSGDNCMGFWGLICIVAGIFFPPFLLVLVAVFATAAIPTALNHVGGTTVLTDKRLLHFKNLPFQSEFLEQTQLSHISNISVVRASFLERMTDSGSLLIDRVGLPEWRVYLIRNPNHFRRQIEMARSRSFT